MPKEETLHLDDMTKAKPYSTDSSTVAKENTVSARTLTTKRYATKHMVTDEPDVQTMQPGCIMTLDSSLHPMPCRI
jgi:hypothetical protein